MFLNIVFKPPSSLIYKIKLKLSRLILIFNGFPTKNNQYFSGQNSWGIGVQSL